jgi:cytochrome c oxidase subunit II
MFETLQRFFSQMFVSSSAQADDINRLFLNFILLSAIILAIVAFMVIGGVIIYRSKKKTGEPRQIFGNRSLELVWTLIPLAIVTILFFLSLKIMKKINEPITKGRKPDVIIIAHQWWWDMEYPEYNVITANELHIPVGKNFLMRIQSADVIHSWWVPALGRKTDAIPGRMNYSWIEADSVGEYAGTCSEYCGTEHAWMRIKVIAETQQQFDKWIEQQHKPSHRPTDSLGILGEKIFQEKTCGSCHTISETPANARIGPDLSHLASRETLLSGMMKNNRKNLKRWLEDPQKVKKGSNMPDFLMNKEEINALTDYLEQLK